MQQETSNSHCGSHSRTYSTHLAPGERSPSLAPHWGLNATTTRSATRPLLALLLHGIARSPPPNDWPSAVPRLFRICWEPRAQPREAPPARPAQRGAVSPISTSVLRSALCCGDRPEHQRYQHKFSEGWGSVLIPEPRTLKVRVRPRVDRWRAQQRTAG